MKEKGKSLNHGHHRRGRKTKTLRKPRALSVYRGRKPSKPPVVESKKLGVNNGKERSDPSVKERPMVLAVVVEVKLLFKRKSQWQTFLQYPGKSFF